LLRVPTSALFSRVERFGRRRRIVCESWGLALPDLGARRILVADQRVMEIHDYFTPATMSGCQISRQSEPLNSSF
jgi:hypothetical protein